MTQEKSLLLAGASVRAAAFSALRAGLRPWCVDLFADLDLAARCPARIVPANRYPHGLLEVFAEAPPGPWMYTGALENRPQLLQQLARLRRLWGNEGEVLQRVRAPVWVSRWLHDLGIPSPVVVRDAAEIPHRGRWLVKPVAGAGGRGIAFWPGQSPAAMGPGLVYFQQYIAGETCAAIYLGDGEQTRLLGVTRQLVGESWLHAAPFHYCGSLGPLSVSRPLLVAFERLGKALGQGLHLRGLFGVDCVVRRGIPYPVEVNPRYTASVELLEHASGTPTLALHRRVFEKRGHSSFLARKEECPLFLATNPLGKAILFARQPLHFPADGPWMTILRQPGDVWDLPAFADIPHAGTRIEAGRPILTFFARAGSLASCLDALRHIAADLDAWLYH